MRCDFQRWLPTYGGAFRPEDLEEVVHCGDMSGCIGFTTLFKSFGAPAWTRAEAKMVFGVMLARIPGGKLVEARRTWRRWKKNGW